MRVYSGITRVKTLFIRPQSFFNSTKIRPNCSVLTLVDKSWNFRSKYFRNFGNFVATKVCQQGLTDWFSAFVLNPDSLMSRFGLSLENFGKKVIRHSTLLKISFTLNKRAFRCIRKTHNKVCSRINSTDAELDCENTLDHRIQLR